MAEKDGRTDEGPSLELPSLGFGRKRGRKAPDPAPEPAPAPAEPPEQAAAEAPAPAQPTAQPTAPPPPVPEADDRPTEPLSPVAPPAPPASPVSRPAPPASPASPVSRPAAPEPPPAPAGKPLFADEAPATRVDQEAVPATEPDEPAEEAPRREFALPSIGTMPASVVTGLLVGVLTVGATWGGLRLCEVVRGTSSCGNPGFLLLLAIVVAMVVIGSMLLRAWQVPDPSGTSFLGVGLLAVITLLVLVDVIFSWWMIIVIPLVSMLTFALAHWVATAIVEKDS